MLNIDTNHKNKGIFNPDPNASGNFGIWNLTTSSLKIDRTNFRFKGVHIVNDEEVMRPDLVAYRKFSDQNKCGSLLKINGYSNPFAIDTGDLFYIPEETSIQAAFDRKKELDAASTTDSNENREFRKSQRAKAFSPSKGREEYLKLSQRGLRNRASGDLPPNVLEEGERPIVTKSGLIFFGPDATSPNG